MKKLLAIMLCVFMLCTLALSSCTPDEQEASSQPLESSLTDESSVPSTDSSEESSAEVMKPDESAKLLWQDSYADNAAGISSADDVYDLRVYKNGSEASAEDGKNIGADDDVKYVFSGSENTRVINLADGYMLTVPGSSVELNLDLAALRVQYTNETSVLTVTKETSSPYGNTENGWNIYLTEWLNRFISNPNFIAANNLSYLRRSETLTDFLPGYTVMTYSIFIRLSKQIERPYYNIAIVRKNDVYDAFYLFVMKSSEKMHDEFDAAVKSFTEITPQGKAKNTQGQYDLTPNENWNDETKAYFEKLQAQTTCDWGAFVRSMPSEDSSLTESEGKILADEQQRLIEALDHDFGILPTYMHIGWGDERHYFPTTLAERYAGGNGFNGKPVLQFTYQYTITNNGGLEGYTPMFDILRGIYDDHFHELARQIKAYGKPVLFRLNNEMNSDWTSYCGMVTLLDPDIFVMTWERLYNIFEEEGVDNCIWIFNPCDVSCPYSSWGEALCYMPDAKYVHALGLTSYEMGNASALVPFETKYRDVYNSFSPNFEAHPWIISEFACGSGGEQLYDWGKTAYVPTTLRRNAKAQATWVREMFDCFEKADQPGYEFVAKIKGAVWFSVNDYCVVDGETYILNNLRLDEELTDTLEAMRDGLARTHKE